MGGIYIILCSFTKNMPPNLPPVGKCTCPYVSGSPVWFAGTCTFPREQKKCDVEKNQACGEKSKKRVEKKQKVAVRRWEADDGTPIAITNFEM